jgi:hypothetical protein
VPAALLAGAITWRLTDEERFLARNLTGYEEYRGRVSARLVPGAWRSIFLPVKSAIIAVATTLSTAQAAI